MGIEREFADFIIHADGRLRHYSNVTCLLFKVGALLCIDIVAVFTATAKDTWCKMSHFRPNSPTRLIRSSDCP